MEKAIENIEVLESLEEKESAELIKAVEAEEQKDQQSEADEMAAQQGAIMAVSMVETLVKMRWSFVQIDDSVRGSVIEKAVPVFRKYGADLPDFLKPYREEIELAMVVAVAGFGVYTQVQMHKAAEEKKKRADDEPKADQPQHAA